MARNKWAHSVWFTVSPRWPRLLYLACVKTGRSSVTAYLQDIVAEALMRDLGLNADEVLVDMPPRRGRNRHYISGDKIVPGSPANTNETVV